MRLTNESPRARWLIMLAVWTFVGVMALWHARLMDGYVGLIGSAGRAPGRPATPLQLTCPSHFMDAQVWVRHALALQESGDWRVRFTHFDNAPAGREVHWSSGLAQLLAVAGRVEQRWHGGTLTAATERALTWITLPLFLGCVMVLSGVAAARAGAGAGAVVAIGLLGTRDFYAGFFPYYADHHGLISAAVTGVVLGVAGMGGGWWRAGTGEACELPDSQRAVRRAALFSAVSGAIGMWLSAATVIPALVIVGAGAVIAGFWRGRRAKEAGATFDGEAWRWWGRVGAGGSVLFYLLEYAPAHLGLRLEVNHPFYALAWWGGAELVAWLVEWRVAPGPEKPAARQLVWPAAALVAAPLAILTLGPRVFLASDPFVARLSASVAEGMSQVQAIRVFGWSEFFMHCNGQLAPLLVAAVVLWRRRKADNLALAVLAAAVVPFLLMAVWKVRWWLNAGGALVVLLSVSLAVAEIRARWRWVVLLGIAAACYLPETLERCSLLRGFVRERAVQALDVAQPLYRDVAGALRASQPTGDIVVLASPNASTGVAYYGNFRCVGTLYWENTPGLKAAAEIFCALTDDEAFAKIRARGITHLAMISDQNYLAEYLALLRPDAPVGELERTFGHRLLYQYRMPIWLRPIGYRPPADLPLKDLTVRLFQVAPEQTVPQALWAMGAAQLAAGFPDDAEQKLQRAIAELPEAQRGAQAFTAGQLCYQHGAHAAAARFFRATFTQDRDPRAACFLGWVLATSADATLRNGPEALALVEQGAMRLPEDHVIVGMRAAALAECGRFAEAAAIGLRALEMSRAAGDREAAGLNEQRLAAYRAGRAWRQ